MNRIALLVVLIASAVPAGCQRSDTSTPADLAVQRTAMQEHTETLLLIHFKLDNALKEIYAAETRAAEGQCNVAGYHAADAYRELQAADELLLDLGRTLQQQFNLDATTAVRN